MALSKCLNSLIFCITEGAVYTMSRKIKSISIPEEQCNWLDRHESINLSLLAQGEINRLIDLEKTLVPKEENLQRIESIMNELRKRVNFIEKNGLIEKYLKEVEEI